MKKILSILLTLAALFSLAVPVFSSSTVDQLTDEQLEALSDDIDLDKCTVEVLEDGTVIIRANRIETRVGGRRNCENRGLAHNYQFDYSIWNPKTGYTYYYVCSVCNHEMVSRSK